MELAERAVMSSIRGAGGGSELAGGVVGSTWYSTTHAEHVRPMLTVSSGPLLEALTYCLAMTTSPTVPPATAALQVCERVMFSGYQDRTWPVNGTGSQ